MEEIMENTSKTKELIIFENKDFGKVEIIDKEGNIYFSATESAKILGYSNPKDAVIRHCKKDGVVFHDIIDSLGRKQKKKFFTEGNLYRLIIHSKLKSAEKFEKWIFDEVLPQIRQTGGYIPVNKEDDEFEILSKAVMIADRTIQNKNQIIETQNKEINILKPKAEGYDRLVGSGGHLLVRQVAKALNIKSLSLYDILRKNNILMFNNEPYSKYMTLKQDYFRTKIYKDKFGNKIVTPLVTGKGIDFIVKLLRKLGYEI
jgi:prophage antirepressor-like protein